MWEEKEGSEEDDLGFLFGQPGRRVYQRYDPVKKFKGK